MSGGSLDYFYLKVASVVEYIRQRATTPEERTLAAKLDFLIPALQNLEWAYSGDRDFTTDALPLLREVITPADMLAGEVARAKAVQRDLERVIDRAGGVLKSEAKKRREKNKVAFENFRSNTKEPSAQLKLPAVGFKVD